MSAMTVVEGGAPYISVRCPMPSCTEELYLTRTESFPIEEHDTAKAYRAGGGVTSSWQVECVAGHVILLPLDCHDESAEFVDSCESCTEQEIPHNDTKRLREIFEAVSP